MPHVAIVFNGIIRSLKYTIANLESHVFKPITDAGWTYDIYCHNFTLDTPYYNIRNRESGTVLNPDEYKLLNPKYYITHEQNSVAKEIDVIKYRTCGNPWLETPDFKSVDYYILAQWSKTQITRLLEKNIADGLAKYDLVFFIRSDVMFDTPLNPMAYLKIIDSDAKCIIPDFNHYGGYNDCMFIAKPSMAIKYGTFFDRLYEISKYNLLHSEKIKKQLLDEYGAIVHMEPAIFFRRIRSNGEVDFRDAVVKSPVVNTETIAANKKKPVVKKKPIVKRKPIVKKKPVKQQDIKTSPLPVNTNPVPKKVRVVSRAFYDDAYLDFFIEYYLALGFDSIVILKSDNIQISIDKYPQDRVQLIYVENHGDDILVRESKYYTDTAFDWILNVDMDEFLVYDIVKFPKVHDFIGDIVAKFNPDQIQFWWTCVNHMRCWPEGTDELSIFKKHIQPGSLEFFKFVKSMARPSKVSKTNIKSHHYYPSEDIYTNVLKPKNRAELIKNKNKKPISNFINFINGSIVPISSYYDTYANVMFNHGFIIHVNTRTLANALIKNMTTKFKPKILSNIIEFTTFINALSDNIDMEEYTIEHRKKLYSFMADKSILPFQEAAYHRWKVHLTNIITAYVLANQLVANLKKYDGTGLLCDKIPFMSIAKEWSILEELCIARNINFAKLKNLLMGLNNVPAINNCTNEQLMRWVK